MTEEHERAIRNAIATDPELAAALEPRELGDVRYGIVLTPQLREQINTAIRTHRSRPAGEAMSEQLERDAEQIDAIGVRIARLANSPPTQIGRLPERLGRAGICLEDARDLIRETRREWNSLD